MPTNIKLVQNQIELNDEIADKVKCYLVPCFEAWVSELDEHKKRYEKLKAHIYIDTVSADVEADYNYNMPGIYKRFMTYIAHVTSNIYPSPDAAFDVQAEDAASTQNIDKQKALIVKELKNLDYYQVLNKYLIDRALKGETVRYITWEERTKKIRRKLSALEKLENKVLELFGEENKEKYKIVEVTDFVGAKIYNIDPHCFVFDKNQVEDWNNCPKIYQEFVSYHEIAQNEAYSNCEELKSKECEKVKDSSLSQDEEEDSSKIELLTFWGSLTLDDGTYVNDYVIVLADRSKIIRFEPNPYPFCPIRRSSFLDDPDTGRSISMFDCAIPLNIYNSETYQKMQKAVNLVADRPMIAPDGMFENKIKEIQPGEIITYKNNSMTPNVKPEFLDYSQALNTIGQMLPLTNSEIESATGIYDNMTGLDASGGRTATEMAMVGQGQEKRLLNEIKDITRELIIKDIEDIAKLNASYRYEPVEVKTESINGIDFAQVDETVTQGNYSYTYGDSINNIQKQAQLKENLPMLMDIAQHPTIQAEIGGGMLEMFKWLLEQTGMDNANGLIEAMQEKTRATNEQMAAQGTGFGVQGIDPNQSMAIPNQPMQPNNIGQYPQGF